METPRSSMRLLQRTTFGFALCALSGQFSCDLLTITVALLTFCSGWTAEIAVISVCESRLFNGLRGNSFPTATPSEEVTARNARPDEGWAPGLGRRCDDTEEDCSRRKTLIGRFGPPSPRGGRAISPPFQEPAWQLFPIGVFEWKGDGVTGRIRGWIRASSKLFELNGDKGIVVGKTESRKLLSASLALFLPLHGQVA